MDFAFPMDFNVKEQDEEKINKYINLTAEVRIQFRVKAVILPIVLEALGTFTTKKNYQNRLKDWK